MARSQSTPARWWRGLLATIAVVAFVLTLAPALDLIEPSILPPIQALGRGFILLGIIGAIVALISRAWSAMMTFVVVALVPLVTLVTFQGAGCTPRGDATPLSIVSINAEHANASIAEVIDLVDERDADLLVLIEVTEPYLEELVAAGLDFEFRTPGPVSDNGASGTVIFSAHPMDAMSVDQSAVTHEQPAVVIDVDGRQTIVRAVHPLAPVPGDLDDWREALREIGQWQKSVGGDRLILVGDFNATRAHVAFREASEGLRDASGRWAEATWPMDRWYPPFATIDHILTRGYTSSDSGVSDIDGTDHRAIWATITPCR